MQQFTKRQILVNNVLMWTRGDKNGLFCKWVNEAPQYSFSPSVDWGSLFVRSLVDPKYNPILGINALYLGNALPLKLCFMSLVQKCGGFLCRC